MTPLELYLLGLCYVAALVIVYCLFSIDKEGR